jgi:cytochrome c-type biogenesis protein CcmH/NrfG
MKRESFVFVLSGTLFGLMIGWILGSQQAGSAAPPATAAASAAPAASSPTGPEVTPLDDRRVADLQKTATSDPRNAEVRTELGNMYFDAQKYELAIPWYEAAYKLKKNDPNVSTDLAIAYFYTNQADRALAQLDASLAIDPKHLKTLLNQGIVRWIGKNDLKGAAESWKRVVDIAPGSEEAKRAQQGLDGLNGTGGHPATGAGRGGQS